MNKPIRFTAEKQQELISRNQFCERLVDFGWILVSPEDLGEDFIVHIYFDGQATGASFYVQEKSVANLYTRRKDEFLPYSFKVKDLLHWEKFVQPVILLVWDVKLREGRWILLNDAIKEIEQKRPKWRNQKVTRIYIPWKNTTDDEGLLKLRHKIGKFMFPIIHRDKEFDMKMNFSFPDSPEGMEVAESLKKFIDDGDDVTLKGSFIKSIEIPAWAKPWFNTNVVELKMGSLGSPDPLPVDINIVSTDGKTEIMKGIELKIVKSGMQTTHLSNAHQTHPLKFEFVFSSSMACSASIQVNDLGGNVNVTREVLKFTQALSTGGKLQLFSLQHNTPLPIDIPVPVTPQMEPNLNFIRLVDYLCLIQAKTGQFIRLPSDLSKITNQDIQTINEFVVIIENGQLRRKIKEMEYEFEIKPPPDIFEYLNKKKPFSLTVVNDKSAGQLFGQSIEMGKAIEQITGILDMTPSQLEKSIKTYTVEDGLHLRLIDCESVVTFPKWVKK